MATLYELSVGSFRQVLSGVRQTLAKGKTWADANEVDTNDIVASRLHETMLPFLFQVLSVAHHTRGALEAVTSGLSAPPSSIEPHSYEQLQALIDELITEMDAVDADDLNALSGNTVTFKMGSLEIPFTAENYILSFALPNLYFHATTAYDILRIKGVPLEKRDFLGRLRMQR